MFLSNLVSHFLDYPRSANRYSRLPSSKAFCVKNPNQMYINPSRFPLSGGKDLFFYLFLISYKFFVFFYYLNNIFITILYYLIT